MADAKQALPSLHLIKPSRSPPVLHDSHLVCNTQALALLILQNMAEYKPLRPYFRDAQVHTKLAALLEYYRNEPPQIEAARACRNAAVALYIQLCSL